MLPVRAVPARSSRRGRAAKTEGGYPFVVGGSPTARPISRHAMAKRVIESIIRRTLRPESRKCSAIVVATRAPVARTTAAWSLVATTTTDRRSPSAPRSRSMNSRTSRPRSPRRAITLTSAVVLRAIIPSSTLLPTPLPAKIPIRCPCPRVISPSIARTPVPIAVEIRARSSGFGRTPVNGRRRVNRNGRPASIGRPRPLTTRPISSSPTLA